MFQHGSSGHGLDPQRDQGAPRAKAARIPPEWSPVGRASVRHPAIGRCASPLLIGSGSRPGQPGPHQPGARASNGRLALVVSSSLALGSRASCGIAACAQQHSDSLLSIGVPKPLAREGRTRAEECGLGGD